MILHMILIPSLKYDIYWVTHKKPHVMTDLMLSVVDTARKKGRVLAAYKKFIDEVTPRTAIQQFIQVTPFIY